jgi:hypothetical protein
LTHLGVEGLGAFKRVKTQKSRLRVAVCMLRCVRKTWRKRQVGAPLRERGGTFWKLELRRANPKSAAGMKQGLLGS